MNRQHSFLNLRPHLASIFASLQVASAHHDVCDQPRVGVVTVLMGQNGHLHTLEIEGVEN